jgi:hypothetical protein
MQTISTKFIPCSNTKGARIKATHSGRANRAGGSITISYPHEYSSSEEAHWQAAKALAIKLGWLDEFICGSTPDGYVFVFANDERFSCEAKEVAA